MSRIIGFAGLLTSSSLASTALDVAIKVAVLLALAVVVTRALRGAPAALRHSIWSAAIGAALLVPLFAVALPTWHLPIPGADAARALAGRVSRAVENAPAPGELSVTRAPATIAPEGAVKAKVRVEGATDDSPTLAAAAAAASDPPTTGRVHVTVESQRDRLPLMLFSIWAVGFVVAIVPLFIGALQLRTIGRRSRDIESDALDDFASRLARSLGVRRVVRVVEGSGGETPMTWGVLHPVVLVPRGFAEWPESRQRDVLLHELAHVARYDCLTQHLARVVCALHWYNPLAWIASRRLRIERERACDDRVLLAGARASEYADHILTIARTLRTPGVAGAAALAMARPSHLEGRLLALLDGRRSRGVLTRRHAAGIGTGALVVAAVLATLSPWSARRADASEANAPRAFPPDVYAERSDTDTVRATPRTASHDSSRSTTRGTRVETLDGVRTEVVNGKAITYGPGSEIVVNTEGARSDKPSEFRLPGCTLAGRRSSSATVSENDSHMKASVKNGDCEITLEREGDIRFNASFTDIAAVDADGWVSIYDKGGSTTHKLRIVSDNGTLSRTWYVDGTQRPYDADAARWLANALQELDRYTNFSNGARMSVIYKERGANGVLDEVAKTESDYGMRSDMERLLKLTKLDQAQTERVLGFARNDISGDYDKSQLLQLLLKQGLITPALQPKFIAAAGTISGDYERRQVLTALVQSGKLGVESQNAVLEAARGISGDYDMRELLLEVVKAQGLSKATAPAFLSAAGRISSDYDMRTLLVTVMDAQQNLDPSIIDSFLELGAKRIDSDYDKAEFFIAAARSGPNTEASRERVAKAAESISSESDYGRVLSSLRKLKNSSGGR